MINWINKALGIVIGLVLILTYWTLYFIYGFVTGKRRKDYFNRVTDDIIEQFWEL